MCNLQEESFFSDINGIVGHSGGNKQHLVGTDQDPVLKCKTFVRNVVLFLALYRVC